MFVQEGTLSTNKHCTSWTGDYLRRMRNITKHG